jgi:hypothetical protein
VDCFGVVCINKVPIILWRAFLGLDVHSKRAVVAPWFSLACLFVILAQFLSAIWYAAMWGGPATPGRNDRYAFNCPLNQTQAIEVERDPSECMSNSILLNTHGTWLVMLAFTGLTFALRISATTLTDEQTNREKLLSLYPILQPVVETVDEATTELTKTHILSCKNSWLKLVLGSLWCTIVVIFLVVTAFFDVISHPFHWSHARSTMAQVYYVLTCITCGITTSIWVNSFWRLRHLYLMNGICMKAVTQAAHTMVLKSSSPYQWTAWWALRRYYLSGPMALTYRMAAFGISTILVVVAVVMTFIITKLLTTSERGLTSLTSGSSIFNPVAGVMIAAVILLTLLWDASSIYVEQQSHIQLIQEQVVTITMREIHNRYHNTPISMNIVARDQSPTVANRENVENVETIFIKFAKGIIPVMTMYDPPPEVFGIPITPAMLKVSYSFLVIEFSC